MSPLLAKVYEAARSAHVLSQNELYASAAGRAYYAMFNMARVLLHQLHDIDLESMKRHKAVHIAFSTHFVSTGLFEAELASRFRSSADIRASADYGNDPVDTAETLLLVETMDKFLRRAETLLAEARP